MKGLGITKFPNRFCSLWLACQMTVLFGMIVSAEERPIDAAEQIKTERESQIMEASKAGSDALALADAGKFADAGVVYTRAMAMLEGLPGEAAQQEKTRLEMAYSAMKVQWAASIMASAQKQYDEGDYASAAKTSSDALFVDEAKIDEINNFIARCQARMNAEQFANDTAITTVYPNVLSDEEQINLLFRQAAVLERAHRYSDAQRKLEQVFLIDPLNAEANTRLRKIYIKLYGAAKEQARGVRYGISAEASWVYVPQVVANRVAKDQQVAPSEHIANSDLYRSLENIRVTAEYDEVDIFEVISEQNRNLLREAPELNASIVTQFTQQVGDNLPKISLRLNNVPMIDLLRYLCMQTDLKMRVDENAVVLGFSSMDDLSTRRFPISADLIHDIAESPNPYYHLGNVIAAGEERSSGGGMGGGSSSVSVGTTGSMGGMGAMGGMGGAMGGGMGAMGGGMPGMPGMGGMGAMGGANSMTSESGRMSMGADEASSSMNTEMVGGASNGLTALGLDMATLGMDIDDSGDSDRTKLGGLGSSTPAVTSSSLKAYFENRGIKFPGSATITYNRRKGEILVTNTVENLRKLEDLLQQLDEIRSPLVSIEAKIIELSEKDIQELGFDWYFNVRATTTEDTNWWIPSNQQPLRHYSNGGANSSDPTDNNYRVVNNLKIFPNFGESLFGKDGDVNMSLTVNAIANNSCTEVLSSPRLTTTSGDMALIKMVETRYFPESWDEPKVEIDGDTVEFTTPVPEFDDGNEIGVVFACRPIVNPDNYTISLYIYPQVTAYLGHENSNYPVKLEAGFIMGQTTTTEGTTEEGGTTEGGTTTTTTTAVKVPTYSTTVNMWMPEIAVREIEVNVQVYDGATVVLGGMVEQYNNQRDDRWPIIGQIPVVGRLFSSQMTESEKRNLLIFVTARLINSDGTPWRSREQFGVPEFIW